jgi:hypothetical protein
LTAGECAASIDPTYGYSADNPVRVGGGAADGQQRARAYLRALGTADGVGVSFERRGYILKDGASLDFFALQRSGAETLIYFDYERYSEPLALVGYLCNTPLALEP